MRLGDAPNKRKMPAPPIPEISLTVVTHYTAEPYHAKRMDVVRLCLSSMVRGIRKHKVELIIWDNGSTREFRDMLREFKPDLLIESANIGPHNARHYLCLIAKGKFINLSDDDILYSPDWLDKQMQIMATYPRVAVVSGSPINEEFKRNWRPAQVFAEGTPGVTVEQGTDLIPGSWRQDWIQSMGRDHVNHNKPKYTETLLTYHGVKAWAHGHHMQMLCPRAKISPFMWPREHLIDFWDIANEISQTGMLQLTTHDRTAVHIGNVIDESVQRIAAEFDARR